MEIKSGAGTKPAAFRECAMKISQSDLVEQLIELMRQFILREIDAVAFVSAYQRAWRELRDSKEIHALEPSRADAIDRVFTASDCFRPHDVSRRTAVDIDEEQLRSEAQEAYDRLTQD